MDDPRNIDPEEIDNLDPQTAIDGKMYQVPELREEQVMVLALPVDKIGEEERKTVERALKEEEVQALTVPSEATLLVANKNDVIMTSKGKVTIQTIEGQSN